MDSGGNATAVWAQIEGPIPSVWANRFVPGAGWGTATRVELSAQAAIQPRVAVDEVGNALGVWEQFDGTRFNIWANRYVLGEGWGIAVPIETDNAGNAAAPQVGMDARGDGVAAWRQHDGTRWRTVVNQYVRGVGWGTPTTLDSGVGGGVLDHGLAVDPGGNATVAWSQCCGPANIYASRYVVGTGWTLEALIEAGDVGDAISPDVSADADGNAVVVWRYWDGSYRSLWANRFVAGAGWGAAEMVEANPGDVGGYPQVAMVGQGNAIAVWEQFDGVRYNVWASYYAVGGTWGASAPLENGTGDATTPAVAANGNRYLAMVVWQQYDGTRWNVMASRFVAYWQAATPLETEGQDAMSPAVGLDSIGHAVAVWRQVAALDWAIWANRFVRDVTAPTVVLTSPTDSVTSLAAVTVAGATEPGAFVRINFMSVAVAPDGSFSTTVALLPGPNVITVEAWDWETNTNTVTRTITRDSTPPALVLSEPTGRTVLATSIVRVAGTVSDPGSGLAELSVNGILLVPGSPWEIGLAFPDGTHVITARARDQAGNVRVSSVTVEVDTALPRLDLLAPTIDLTNQASVSVVGETEATAAVRVNALPVSVDPSGMFSTTVNLVEGPNAIDVAATDAAGNAARVSKVVTRDSVAPALAVTTPSGGARLTANVVRVTGTVSDAGSGIARLSVNGIAVVPTGTWSVDLAFADGAQLVTAVAEDQAGNTATVSLSMTVDTAAPALLLTAPSYDLTNGPSVVVAGTTEPGASVAVNGQAATIAPDGSFSVTLSLVEGPNSIVVVATDSAGNVATLPRSITRDSIPPPLTLAGPATGLATMQPAVLVSGTTEPGARVVVNGIVVSVAGDGSFAFLLALSEGANVIAAEARDLAGNVAMASVAVTYENPVPGLQLDLRDAAQELNDTKNALADVQEELRGTRSSLDRANLSLAGLGTQMMLGLVLVVLLLAALQAASYRSLRQRMRPPKEEPKT